MKKSIFLDLIDLKIEIEILNLNFVDSNWVL